MLNLLYMDESYHSDTGISALTGVLVPVDRYEATRLAFYKVLRWYISPNEDTIAVQLPELHAVDMLRDVPGVDDDRRLSTFARIVDLVVDHRLLVFRSGYFITSNVRRFFKEINEEGQAKKGEGFDLLGLCWTNVCAALEPLLASEMVIPIMDSHKDRSAGLFSGPMETLEVFRAIGREDVLSLRNSRNIIGEVFYADSKYSIFTQVADVVSYLRQVSDAERLHRPLTPFKRQLAAISARLAPAIAWENVGELTIKGMDPDQP